MACKWAPYRRFRHGGEIILCDKSKRFKFGIDCRFGIVSIRLNGNLSSTKLSILYGHSLYFRFPLYPAHRQTIKLLDASSTSIRLKAFIPLSMARGRREVRWLFPILNSFIRSLSFALWCPIIVMFSIVSNWKFSPLKSISESFCFVTSVLLSMRSSVRS